MSDPRIVNVEIRVNGKLAETWAGERFHPGENDTVLRLTPKIIKPKASSLGSV